MISIRALASPNHRNVKPTIVVVLGLLMFLTSCDGGSSFNGSVRDINGDPIPGAKLTFETPKGSVKRETETAKDGSFSRMFLHSPFNSVTILISVNKEGFKNYKREFPAGDHKDLQIILEREGEAEKP